LDVAVPGYQNIGKSKEKIRMCKVFLIY